MSVRSPDRHTSSLHRSASPPSARSFLHDHPLHALNAGGRDAFSPTPLAPRSVAAGAFDATDADVSRVQLLLRLMDMEKRLHRADERARLHEDATKQRLNEVASVGAVAAERSAALLARLSEVELSAREAEIGVQSLEQRQSVESDAVTQLKAHVQQWREESKRELREEFNKNINLRNATHHAELVSLMDKQQEQQAKIIRAHELTSQGVHTKLQAIEAKWSARYESIEQKLEQQTHDVLQWREKSQQQELSIQRLQHQYEQQLQQSSQQLQKQLQTMLDAQIAPLQQQLTMITQLHEQQTHAHTTQLQSHYTQLQTHASQLTTVHAQLEYASTHLQEKSSALEQSIQQVKSAQQSIQSSMLSVSDGLAASLTSLKEIVPSRSDLAMVESRLNNSIAQLGAQHSGLESHVQTALSDLEVQCTSQVKELREEAVTPLNSDLATLKTSVAEVAHGLEQQRKIVRRSTHSLQLVEEQLAAVQAKVLVAHETPFVPAAMMAPGSPLHALARTLPRYSAPASSFASSPPPAPYQSPFPTLSMHLSDAAGLKLSPTRASSAASANAYAHHLGGGGSEAYRTRAASPHSAMHAFASSMASPAHRASAEDDFVNNFLGGGK